MRWSSWDPEAGCPGPAPRRRYLPDAVLAGGREPPGSGGEDSPPGLPLLEGRFQAGRTLIYVCRNRTCGLPVESVDEAWPNWDRASS